MGVVFEARDPLIGRTVALKMIRLDAFGTPDEREWLQERLFREARSAGALSHPGIVIVYDLGTSEGLTYIAMEFVEGPTLEQLLASSASFPWKDALSIARQMAEALDHAHAAGVVHRDVKPANVMLQRGRIVKITDFGIAKITSTQQITRTGTTMGTPSYMSPEQITAKAVDGRADQFSLAVLAYQILTGVKPFQGESLPNLVYQIVYEERPSARSVNAALPEAVDEVLRRGLARLPEDRYHSCVAFVNALEAALETPAGSPKAVAPAPETAAGRERQESEFTALFGEFIEARRRRERVEKLGSMVQQVDGLLDCGDLSAAAPVLADAREEFGDEPALLQAASRLEQARQTLVEGAVNRAREWLETRNFAAALSVLDTAAAEHGKPPAIVDLRAQVVEEQAAAAARRAYEAELEKTLGHARALLARDAPGDAVAYLETVTTRYGLEGEFNRLLGDATAAHKSADARNAKLQACISSVEKFLASGNWKAARTALAYARNDFASEPALDRLQFRIEQVRQVEIQESQARAEVPRVSPQPEPAPEPRQPPYSPPAVIKKRATIPRGFLVGASAAAAVVFGLLLVKVFVSSSAHIPPRAIAPESGKTAAKPEPAAPSPVRITQFYASPPNPVEGQKTLVCYGVENANEVRIDPPVDRVWPSPNRCLETTTSRTVTYTLTAVRGAENVSKSITVQIEPPPAKRAEAELPGSGKTSATPSFDCSKAKMPTETLICRDPELATLERAMVSAYRQSLNQTPSGQKASVIKKHREWLTHYLRTCDAPKSDADRKRCAISFLQDHTEAENVSKSIAVQTSAPPVKIIEFSADKPKIVPGEIVTACFKVKNAASVEFFPGGIIPGSACGSDLPRRTTTYTLIAHGADGRVDTARVTVTVAAPEKTAPKVDAEPAKPKEGRIIWSGNLAPGADLTLDGGTASTGTLTAALPGIPVTVEVHLAGLSLTTVPNAGNGWKRLTIHNAPEGTAQSIISIKWTARP
jgi:uncharacterized protein YecT (DUF1311 family)